MNNISSPQATTDESIERILQDHSPAPRVTLAELQDNVAYEHYFTAADGVDGRILNVSRAHDPMKWVSVLPLAEDDGMTGTPAAPLELLTFCVLVLKNGFTVTGESACASPENFNAEIGRKIARENARQKIWPLMSYELMQRLGANK